MNAEVPIPFYNRDDEHVITLSIELDASGRPPNNAEIIGPDDTGSRVHVLYQLDERADHTPPWRYTETHRVPELQPAEPGSNDAVRRIRAAREWTLPRTAPSCD